MELNKIYEGDSKDLLKGLEESSITAICSDPPYQLTSSRVYPKGTKLDEISDQLKENVASNTAYGAAIRGFMGQEWDILPTTELLKECFRVLKPGGWAMWLMTPRQDSMALFISRLAEAGFNVNFSSIYYTFAQGFPKSLNLGKSVDRKLGVKREIIDENLITPRQREKGTNKVEWTSALERKVDNLVYGKDKRTLRDRLSITEPATSEAKLLDGWHTMNLKPAVEVIIVSQKPISGKSFTDQALQYAKEKLEGKEPKTAIGGVNIDSCRIPYENKEDSKSIGELRGNLETSSESKWGYKERVPIGSQKGRYPGTLLISSKILDTGKTSKSAGIGGRAEHGRGEGYGFKPVGDAAPDLPIDEGDFSRYFSLDNWFSEKLKELPEEIQKTFPFMIIPKPATSERNAGFDLPKGVKETQKAYSPLLKEEVEVEVERKAGSSTSYNQKCRKCGGWHIGSFGGYKCDCAEPEWEEVTGNMHATLKPLSLMSYLITLTTSENDIVLDPFVGSGTTCIAAYMLKRRFLGFEKEHKFAKIAQERLAYHMRQWKL